MIRPNYVQAGDAFAAWREAVLTGERPLRWRVGGAVFDSVEVGPGLVVLVGGAPGAGKTAIAMQWTFDGLRLSPDLRVLVANCESSPSVLLDRELARLSGVSLGMIRERDLAGPQVAARIDAGLRALEEVADRLAFLEPPFSLENVAAAADDFGANLLVLDYAQRFEVGNHIDRRTIINALMDYLRQFAEAGIGCVVLAAVGRTKDAAGRSSYDAGGLNLASFRESSELEFGCDSAYMLSRGKQPGEANLRCLKNRHGEPIDLRLRFDGALQRFEVFDDFGESPVGLTQSLRVLWGSTPTAEDGHSEGADVMGRRP